MAACISIASWRAKHNEQNIHRARAQPQASSYHARILTRSSYRSAHGMARAAAASARSSIVSRGTTYHKRHHGNRENVVGVAAAKPLIWRHGAAKRACEERWRQQKCCSISRSGVNAHKNIYATALRVAHKRMKSRCSSSVSINQWYHHRVNKTSRKAAAAAEAAAISA